ncbi:MAG TPA: FAD-binding protein, partial [Solirubrobacteraceae bacterium]|nr:FAD-binding protein [Solirubrobacteraceae bacterium]
MSEVSVYEADVVVVGAGLAGLVATAELTGAGKKVVLVEQEPEQSLGGQAWWSLGGLFMVDTPEQRRWGVKDSAELAWQDWSGTAAFDRPEDEWPKRWAEAYVEWAGGGKREWLYGKGLRWLPNPGWAERGGYGAIGHGNSVPRFHLTWGTGPGVVAPFLDSLTRARAGGAVEVLCRHRVDELTRTAGAVDGVKGRVLEHSGIERGQASSRIEAGEFEVRAPAVLVTSGGIGGNLDLVRENWPKWLGDPPKSMVAGVPEHVDGRMLQIAERAGGSWIGKD